MRINKLTLKFIIAVLVIALIGIFVGLRLKQKNNSTLIQKQTTVVSQPAVDTQTTAQISTPTTTSPAPTTSAPAPAKTPAIPTKILLAVPFTSQAPLLNWDQLHEEACEEASLIEVIAYYKKWDLTPARAEQEIQDLVAWEKENGYADDLTAQEMADITQKKYDLKATVSSDVSETTIKQALTNGNPVIVPVDGQDIGNPYYTAPGPPYHMLTLVGFEKDTLITNDVGTKRGLNYAYPFTTVLAAIHDWTGSKDTVRSGGKAMVIITQ